MELTGVRWLTFDCYGTLIDWESGILGEVRPLLAARGIPARDEEILARYAEFEAREERGPYKLYREVLRNVMSELGRVFDLRLPPAQLTPLGDSLGDWPAFAETPAALAALQRRFRLAVISNIDNDLFALTTPKLGVALDATITAQQCRSYKPSLNNFRTAIGKLGVAPEEVVHVAESRYHDIAPARSLGIRSVWVNRRAGVPGASGGADATPDLEVASLSELAARFAPSKS